ncbi:MAG: MATE family efflux transporter [Firmicutes bacterium]|nr:MATE family efflux transporter [Bacillota bacterium]
MNENINMTEGTPLKLLLSFSLPLMLGNMFQQFYTVADTAIVGQGVGIEALAALGTVDWLNWMVLAMVQGFTQGLSIEMAQKYGNRDVDGLKKVIGQSVRISVIIVIGYTIAMILALPLFLTLLRVPEELRSLAHLYSGILFCGLPFTMFFNFCAATLRAVGNSKTPLKAMVLSALTNICLDLIAVFVLHWGIAGAAMATVISQAVSGTFCLLHMRHMPELHVNKEHLRREKVCIQRLLRLGIPMGAKNMIVALGGIFVQAVANGFGTTFIAGFAATNKLMGLLEAAAISYGYGVTTYVGQNYGAGKHARIHCGLKSALKLSIGTAVAIAALMILFGHAITGLFISADTAAMTVAANKIAYHYLCAAGIFLPALYLLHVFMAALQGIGDTTSPLIAGCVELVVRISLAALAGWFCISYGLFAAECMAWVGGAIYLILQYRKKMKTIL